MKQPYCKLLDKKSYNVCQSDESPNMNSWLIDDFDTPVLKREAKLQKLKYGNSKTSISRIIEEYLDEKF